MLVAPACDRSRPSSIRGVGRAYRPCSSVARSLGQIPAGGARFEQRESGPGAAERAGHGHEIPRARAVAPDERAGILGPADHGHRQGKTRRRGYVPPRDRHAMLARQRVLARAIASGVWGSIPSGTPSTRYASEASLPIAARSDSAPARARCPISPGESWALRKWTPSTIASIETTAYPPARTTAASSPMPRTTRAPRGCKQRLELGDQLTFAHC